MKCIKGLASQGFHSAVVRYSKSAVLTGLIETLLGTIQVILPRSSKRRNRKGKSLTMDYSYFLGYHPSSVLSILIVYGHGVSQAKMYNL